MFKFCIKLEGDQVNDVKHNQMLTFKVTFFFNILLLCVRLVESFMDDT